MDLQENLYLASMAIIFLTLLSSEVSSRSLENASESEVRQKDYIKKSCLCHVEDSRTGKVIYNYGEIDTYQNPDTHCHDAHRQCRIACRDKLNINVPNEKGTPNRGFVYCDSYGQVTKSHKIILQAVWKVDNCRTVNEIDSIKTVPLCCGHSFINVNHRNSVKVFGWNPDCQAQRFDLGKSRP